MSRQPAVRLLKRPQSFCCRLPMFIILIATITSWQLYAAISKRSISDRAQVSHCLSDNTYGLGEDDQGPWERNHPVHWMRDSVKRLKHGIEQSSVPRTQSIDATVITVTLCDERDQVVESSRLDSPLPNKAPNVVSEQPLRLPLVPGRMEGREKGDLTNATTRAELNRQTSEKSATISEQYRFPALTECTILREKADTLPDLLFVPFEDAVKDIDLMGWEDRWMADARYDGPNLPEPRIDFVYNWVNGSQAELTRTMRPYEVNSSLNDPEGAWLASHGSNRYREWDELRYSMRSVERYASNFTNRIQILVNAFEVCSGNGTKVLYMRKQQPSWLSENATMVQVLSQEDFFGQIEAKCLPSFNSLTIENQLYNTKSETDRVCGVVPINSNLSNINIQLFALSDDMILGKPHAASDLYSPLFGPTLGFKDNAYNTLQPPTNKDAERFGEKPFLIYTSWLLNRRFGARKRKGQVHFGHSLSRDVSREAITSFPRPALRSAAQRFRGETGFQLYSWYLIFHYTIERHREALLWSYIMLRSDTDDDGYFSWPERRRIMRDIEEGMSNDSPELFRTRMFYRVADSLEQAGLERPRVNTDVLWTSLDGPVAMKDLDCDAFDIEDCLAPGFSISESDAGARSPLFSSAAIFDRIARETPHCGDCLLKLVLNRRRAGLGPVLPHRIKKAEQRAIVVKALMRYQYTIVQPDASFHMITDAEQVEHVLIKPFIKHGKRVGQLCLNDDVVSQDEGDLVALKRVMGRLFDILLPEKSSFEE